METQNIEEEIFKEIKDYPNYEISNYGKLRNKKTNRIIKDWIIGGYKTTRIINKTNKNKKICVHRLVALHFCDNPNNHNEIDHISRDKLNNFYKNLRWCSHSENCRNKNISSKITKSNTSGYHHISIGKKNKYYVRIQKNDNKIFKSFQNLEDAIKFRDEKINLLNKL